MKTSVLVKVLSAGKKIAEEFELLYVDIAFEANRIPWARLAYLDGDAAKPEFKLCKSGVFEPGKKVKIQISYLPGGQPEPSTEFEGLVTAQRLEVNARESMLIIELRDKAWSMTKGRKSRVFEKIKDGKIFEKLVSEHGLSKGQWGKTTYEHEKMVQYHCTDWDFMLSRAEANSFLVLPENGKIVLLAAGKTLGKTHTLIYGNDDIYNFEMEADAEHQFGEMQGYAWDLKNQKRLAGTKAGSFKMAQGNLDAAGIAKKLGAKASPLRSGISSAQTELDNWASGELARSRLSLLRGRLSIPGLPKVHLGETLELKQIAPSFDGKAMISGIRHRVSVNGWDTDLQFGLPGEAFAQKENISEPTAAGLLPGVHGLQIGVIDKFEADPDKEFRVRVRLPAIDEDKSFLWARLATPEAGKERGYFFRPEPNDEVIVGFLNNDPRQAIVLGALYGSKNVPPKGLEKLDADNAKKALVTKSGMQLLFDDKEQLLTIKTSDKNTIVINEKEKTIELKDENKNEVSLSKDGIKMKSDQLFQVEVAGSKLVINDQGIEISSAKKMKIKASADLEISGAKIDLK